jgi:molybdate transport system regulatory protein
VRGSWQAPAGVTKTGSYVGEYRTPLEPTRPIGVRYEKAWERLQAVVDGAAEPPVGRSAGGAGGGATRLTGHAAAIVAAYREVERPHARMRGRLSR